MATDKKKIQHRRDTAANWIQANPILRDGELGIDTTNNAVKVGTGLNWNSTPYLRNEAYLTFDARGAGEEFAFILPTDCIAKRLDTLHGDGSWSISHNGQAYVSLGTMFDTGVFYKGHYVLRNEGMGRNVAQLTVIPTELAISGKFKLNVLPLHADAELEPSLTTTLAAVIEQANSFSAGDLIGFAEGMYALATGSMPVVGVVQAADATHFRVAYEGFVLGLSGLVPGMRYYRQPDGTLGTLENGNPLLLALTSESGLFTRAAGTGGSSSGIRPYETGQWQMGEIAISGTQMWQAQQNIADSQSLPTQNNAYWTKVADWTAPDYSNTYEPKRATQGTAYNQDFGRNAGQVPEIGATLGTTHTVETDASGKLISVVKNPAYNRTFGNSATTVTEGNDPRLSDQRVPTNGSVTEEKLAAGLYLDIYSLTAAQKAVLETPGNWDEDGQWTGAVSAITGTSTGHKHYNAAYFYEAVGNDTWIRMIRG